MILGGVEREPRLMLGLDENNNVMETVLLFSGCWGFERGDSKLTGGRSYLGVRLGESRDNTRLERNLKQESLMFVKWGTPTLSPFHPGGSVVRPVQNGSLWGHLQDQSHCLQACVGLLEQGDTSPAGPASGRASCVHPHRWRDF